MKQIWYFSMVKLKEYFRYKFSIFLWIFFEQNRSKIKHTKNTLVCQDRVLCWFGMKLSLFCCSVIKRLILIQHFADLLISRDVLPATWVAEFSLHWKPESPTAHNYWGIQPCYWWFNELSIFSQKLQCQITNVVRERHERRKTINSPIKTYL